METKTCSVCEGKAAHHSEQMKKELASRLNRIEGQIRGITRMISEDVYCDDVLNQISSVNSALNGVKKLLLEAHLKGCIVEQIQNGDVEVIDEFMKTIEKMIK